MADLIDRQAAIEVTEAVWSVTGDLNVVKVGQQLKDLPSAQQWIPCSERLPEDDDWKIITVCDESGDSPYIYSASGWYLDTAKCWIVDADQRYDVVAWMEMPEPWKGET